MKPRIAFNLSRQRAIIALVALTLFAQILMPIQSHTRLVKTGDGRLVVLCTLQGLVSAEVDDDGVIDAGKVVHHTGQSAAVKFSQLLASASPDAFIPRLLGAPAIHAAPTMPALARVPRIAFRQQPIRAPPLSTLV